MDEKLLSALAVMLAGVILLQLIRLPLRAMVGTKPAPVQMGCASILAIPIVVIGLALEVYFLFLR